MYQHSAEDSMEDNDALKQKANISDVMAMSEMKANKYDIEVIMRCIDI